MNKLPFFTVLALLVVMAVGCAPDPLAIEVPAAEPQIVVFSQIVPEEVITVTLTRTFGALDFSEERGDSLTEEFLSRLLISDATVTVAYAGEVDTLRPVGEGTGTYVSTVTPQTVGEEYLLRILTTDGKELSATSVVLPRVDFTAVVPVVRRTEEDTLVTVDFTLTDPTERNWYVINYFATGSDGIGTLGNFFAPGNATRRRTVLLDDATFTGPQYSGTTELPDFEPTDTVVVSVANVSEGYYKFLRTRQAAGNFLARLTSDPVSTPTNVTGGLGYFSLHVPEGRVFDLGGY